jgi:polyhydroxybutyrate depolymerase
MSSGSAASATSGTSGAATGSIGATGAASAATSGATTSAATSGAAVSGSEVPSATGTTDAAGSGGGLAGDATAGGSLEASARAPEAGPVLSAGCGMTLASNVKLGQWTDMADPGSGNPPPIMVNGVARGYWLRVPPNYDSSKSYKVIYEGAPCGQPTGGNGQPNPSGMGVFNYASVDNGEAIQVGVDYGFAPGRPNCYDDQNPQSNDFEFFPVLKKMVESMLCIDTSNVFLSGYSSGSWWVNQMTCGFGNEIRGTVEATGGEPPQPTCVTGAHIASLFLHDVNDQLNSYAGILPACARALKNNGCATTACDPSSAATTQPWPVPAGLTIPGMGKCVQFDGCPADSPVVFCTTVNVDPSGSNHYETVNSFIPPLFWNFIGQF